MFTGLILGTGTVADLTWDGDLCTFRIGAPSLPPEVALGDSIAVNGCCLTVIRREGDFFSFNLLRETLERTSFQAIGPGSLVNLELSLRTGDRLGGHFVTGHVDTVGTVTTFEPSGADHRLTVSFAAEYRRFLVPKGSIAIDGISLTVADLDDATPALTAWLIPHTVAVTNLNQRKVGDPVNLEFDLIGKYALRDNDLRLPAP